MQGTVESFLDTMSTLTRAQALLLTSFVASFFPLSLALLLFNYAVLVLNPRKSLRRRIRSSPAFKAKTVLLTGVATPQGIRLARAFHDTGHNVIGANHQTRLLPIHTRFSVAVQRYHRLRFPAESSTDVGFATELTKLIENEKVDLWIDCSENTAPFVLAEARRKVTRETTCICFVPDENHAPAFESSSNFLTFASEHSLPVPDAYQVKSRADIHNILNRSQGKRRYVLNAPEAEKTNPRRMLPQHTVSQTYHEVSQVKIQQGSSWVLKQDVEGLARYQTFSIVVQGQIQAFAAFQVFPTGSLILLSTSSPLSQSMQRYLEAVAARLGSQFNSHLCLEFCVEERVTENGVDTRILPLTGRTSIDRSVCFFKGIDGSLDLVHAYLRALSSPMNGHSSSGDTKELQVSTPTTPPIGIYSLGADVLRLVMLPIVQLFKFKSTPITVLRSVFELLNHIVIWQDTTYDSDDPFPFWYIYQVYLPLQLLAGIFSGHQPHVDEMKLVMTA